MRACVRACERVFEGSDLRVRALARGNEGFWWRHHAADAPMDEAQGALCLYPRLVMLDGATFPAANIGESKDSRQGYKKSDTRSNN